MHYDLNARGLFPLLMGFRRAEISMDLFFVQRGTFARLEYQMGVHSTYEAEAWHGLRVFRNAATGR